MTESRTGSSTSPFSSPSSVRIVSTAKKYLRGPQAEGVSGNDPHESCPTPNCLAHHTPQPCRLSPASIQDKVGVPSKTHPRQLLHIPTASQGGCHDHQPTLPKLLKGSKQLVYSLQHSPHDEVKLRASQHEDTQEGGDGTVHHRGKGVLQRCG